MQSQKTNTYLGYTVTVVLINNLGILAIFRYNITLCLFYFRFFDLCFVILDPTNYLKINFKTCICYLRSDFTVVVNHNVEGQINVINTRTGA